MQHVSASYWSAWSCSTIGKHTLSCNRYEIKCFVLQKSTDQKFLWVCLLHSIVIFHLSLNVIIILQWCIIHTPRYFTWSKLVHVHHLEKHLIILFWVKKNTNCFDTIKSDFVFSSIVTTNIQKTLQPINAGAEHTYIISKHQMIHNHISHSASHPGWSQLDWEFVCTLRNYLES